MQLDLLEQLVSPADKAPRVSLVRQDRLVLSGRQEERDSQVHRVRLEVLDSPAPRVPLGALGGLALRDALEELVRYRSAVQNNKLP